MGFTTRAFDLFYKRVPTGSKTTTYIWSGSLAEYWFTASITSGNNRVSHSFLNFPDDISSTVTYLTTRDVTNNAGYRALPWSSHACDMLWNCLVPSASYRDTTITLDPYDLDSYGYDSVTYRQWSYKPTSRSFHKTYRNSSFGVSSYPITSSWVVIDYRIDDFQYLTYQDQTTVGGYTGITYPTYIGSGISTTSDDSKRLAYDITYPTVSGNSTSSIDLQYFDRGQGVGITRAAISRSLVTQSLYSSDDTPTGLRKMTEALKARRLFFPIPVNGSGTSGGTDYWFQKFTGYSTNNIFTENGGIYNVQFSLKKPPGINNTYPERTTPYNQFYPDNGTYMNVFIHNVIPQIPSSSARVAGADGWYPPTNNIVTIGNSYGGGPALSFYDIQTGYQIEKFNFNVVQYGYPAQLCIEAQGDLTSNTYFGIILNDLEICKVGVTTDPNFIKPATIAQTTLNNPYNPNNPLAPVNNNPVPAPPYNPGA